MKRLVRRERFLLDLMRLFAQKLIRAADGRAELTRVCQEDPGLPDSLAEMLWVMQLNVESLHSEVLPRADLTDRFPSFKRIEVVPYRFWQKLN